MMGTTWVIGNLLVKIFDGATEVRAVCLLCSKQNNEVHKCWTKTSIYETGAIKMSNGQLSPLEISTEQLCYVHFVSSFLSSPFRIPPPPPHPVLYKKKPLCTLQTLKIVSSRNLISQFGVGKIVLLQFSQYAERILKNEIAKYINKIYLWRMKEYASEVQNVLCMKS